MFVHASVYGLCIRSNVVHAHVVTKVTVNIKQDYSFGVYIGRNICSSDWRSAIDVVGLEKVLFWILWNKLKSAQRYNTK